MGSPWLDAFTASSKSTSRGEGANKAELKKTKRLALPESYRHITYVHDRKKNESVIQIRQGSQSVDARKLTLEWFPDILELMDVNVSGYCKAHYQDQMGSSGN